MCGHFKAADAQQKLSYNLSSPAGQSLEKLVECLLAAWILREKQRPSYWRSGWENNTGLFAEALVKYLQTFYQSVCLWPEKRAKAYILGGRKRN